MPVDHAARPGTGRHQARGRGALAVCDSALDALAGWWCLVGEIDEPARRPQLLRRCADLRGDEVWSNFTPFEGPSSWGPRPLFRATAKTCRMGIICLLGAR